MRKTLVVMMAVIVVFSFVSWKNQDEEDIAKALVDRLTCPHVVADVVDFESSYFRVDEKEGLAHLIFKGNKVIRFRVRVHDEQSGKFGLVGNIVEINSKYGDRAVPMFINLLGKKLFWKGKKGEILHLADLEIEHRRNHFRAHLKKGAPLKFDLCMKRKAGYFFIGSGFVAKMNIKEMKIKGAPRWNLIRVSSNSGNPFYLNRSRGLIFFKSKNPRMAGRFASLTVSVGMHFKGHPEWDQ